MKKNIVEIFFEAAERYPQNIAMVHKNDRISYQDLASKVESCCVYLEKKGIKKGDKIMVFIPMSIQLYTTVLALFSLGAIVVFVDEWSNRSRLEKAIKVVDIDSIIAPPKFIWLAYILPSFRKIKRKFSMPKNISSSSFSFRQMQKDDTALITFTTGSTGVPKAADRTHQFLWEQFRILKDEIAAQENDKCLITLPIVLLSILGTGATGYVADFNQKKPHKLNAAKQLQFAKDHHISLLIASPFYIEELAKVGQDALPSLKTILTGGAPVFPASAKRIQSSFPFSRNVVAYGSTEAEPISTINMKTLLGDHEQLTNGLCVGKVHPEVQFKIIRITSEPVELCSQGWVKWELNSGIGEIVVTGPHVLDQYYNSEKAFKENKIVDGSTTWHRTGDSGIFKDGKLFLHGRCAQLIQTKDRYISPFIIENQLQEMNEIAFGTLIKHHDDLILCIELHDGFTEKEAKASIQQHDILYDQLKTLNKIPRDPRHYSKIDYGKLRQLLS